MQLGSSASSSPSLAIPPFVVDAVRRASEAELELARVLPLFMTKLDASPDAEPSRELDAFAAQLRLAHAAAIHALHVFRTRRAAAEVVAAAYESLAVLIEQFARRAGLDAPELD